MKLITIIRLFHCALQVKKIMNSVYQQLRSQFTAEDNYTGAAVLGAILEAIKVNIVDPQLSGHVCSQTYCPDN